MCGIVGAFYKTLGSTQLAQVQRANDVIRHRGPDGEGFFVASEGTAMPCSGPETLPELGLSPLAAQTRNGPAWVVGHRRLSIIDLTPSGHQPMSSPCGKVWISFNGEIYNYLELRDELASQWNFQTRSDTEVALAALSVWGPEAVKRFVGMFGIAFFDLRDSNQKLFLFRDPLGIKPLYWTREAADGFAFCSEIKGLFALGLKARADSSLIRDYLCTSVTDHTTGSLFKGVSQLPGGGLLELETREGAIRIVAERRYWEADQPVAKKQTLAESAAQLREAFLKSLRLHLRADVPVAYALSGGIDSSAIVCGARHLEPTAEMHSFSYTAVGHACNEERWMDLVIGLTKVDSHKCSPDGGEMVKNLESLCACQDEPFPSTSYFAEYAIYQLVHSQNIRVLLNGQGADEMFAGYEPYRYFMAAGLIKRGQWLAAARFSKSLGGSSRQMLKILARGAGLLLPAFLRMPLERKVKGDRELLLNGHWINSVDSSQPSAVMDKPTGLNVSLQTQLRHTLVRSSIPLQLRCQDRSSMAFSVESRVPFLTPELCNLALQLPDDHLMDGSGTSKKVLREALRGLVPAEILERRDKIGFETPEASWLLSVKDWVRDLFSSDVAAQIPCLDVKKCLATWEGVEKKDRVYEPSLWRALNTILWSRQFAIEWE